MERSLLKEIDKKSLDVYVKENRFAQMLYPTFFPTMFTPSLTWESLRGVRGATVMGDVNAYNATPILKNRDVATKASGDIPKITISRKMDEKDYNEYLQLQQMARGDSEKQALLKYIFDDIDFAYNGVDARCEYMCMQALSIGELTLDGSNSEGLRTTTAVSFGIPTGNKKFASGGKWSAPATAKPIDDIKGIVKLARSQGNSIAYIVMDVVEFNNMIVTDQVKALFPLLQRTGDIVNIEPTINDINAYLRSRGLPVIITVDQQLRHETRKGDRTVLNPWKEGYVSFIPELNVGNLKHGPIAIENATTPNVVKSKRGHILLMKYSQMRPFGEYTDGQANAFPVFNDVSSIYLLNAESTTAFK